MAFTYLSNTPLDEALEGYLDFLKSRFIPPESERTSTSLSLGRLTARAVYAHICAPHYNACAMDGIALRADVTFGASRTTPVILESGKYVAVDTGDPLPEGCDAVVMIEDVIEENNTVKLLEPAAPWQHVRQIGEDICAGDMILPSFTRITPAAIGAMLAGGVTEVEVVKVPVVGIIPTGDEIVEPTANPAAGDIIEFNSSIFSALLHEWGAEAKTYPIVPDDKIKIIAALKSAVSECDMVLLGAGSSAGREDYSSEAIAEAGEVFLHGIAIKPGKPAVLGASGHKPVIGVPGYPVSGIIVLEQVVKPVLELMKAAVPFRETSAEAICSSRIVSSLKYREFVRVRLGCVDGRLIATPLSRGAGVVSSFVKADGIIDIPLNCEGCEESERVTVRLNTDIEDIRRTLVITGSHDPLIDEAADIMRRAQGESRVASSHVGSMGAITALMKGEAHLGGIHLIDESTGRYNIDWLRRYFPSGGVLLIGGVKRKQGIMCAAGNPLGISGIRDLTRCSYVNRQRGAGTRILLDYLMKNEAIEPKSIYGYGREEYTHTAVAALIASGSADAGLGIYSAAKMYGLDFIPVADESYDFICLESAFELPAVQSFIETLKSAEFAKRLTDMGGYELSGTGVIKEWR